MTRPGSTGATGGPADGHPAGDRPVADRPVAVVTGAGRGLGRATALLLARRGYAVVATDVDPALLAGLDREDGLGGENGTPGATGAGAGRVVAALAHDVRDPDAHRAVAATAAAYGPVRVWVNNAGVLGAGDALAADDADLRRVVDVDLLGVVHGCRAAVEVMRDHGLPADVVNVGSMSAFGPVPGLAAYAASKAAVVSWTTSLAYELADARLPVRPHVLCPDGVGTPMLAENVDDPATTLVFTAGRVLTTGEVAQAVCDLVGTRTLVRTLPRRRGALVRLSGLAPRLVGVTLPLLRRVGDRRRRRAAHTLAAGEAARPRP